MTVFDTKLLVNWIDGFGFSSEGGWGPVVNKPDDEKKPDEEKKPDNDKKADGDKKPDELVVAEKKVNVEKKPDGLGISKESVVDDSDKRYVIKQMQRLFRIWCLSPLFSLIAAVSFPLLLVCILLFCDVHVVVWVALIVAIAASWVAWVGTCVYELLLIWEVNSMIKKTDLYTNKGKWRDLCKFNNIIFVLFIAGFCFPLLWVAAWFVKMHIHSHCSGLIREHWAKATLKRKNINVQKFNEQMLSFKTPNLQRLIEKHRCRGWIIINDN